MKPLPTRVKVSMVDLKRVVRPVTRLGEALSITVPADGYVVEANGQTSGARIRGKLSRDRQAIEQAISVAGCRGVR
jgi:putative molybdopterin biosynthesis protein